jgi:hypothetical protein
MKDEHERLQVALQALIEARDIAAGVELAALDRVNRALRAFERAATLDDVLETLLLEFSQEFGRASIFVVAGPCLKGWRSLGLDSTTEISNLAIPLTVESPLTQSMTDQKAVTLAANPGREQVGIFGSAIDCAIAVPILVEAEVVAVAYGEILEPAPGAASNLKIAELLGGHAGRCLAAIGPRYRAQLPAASPAGADKTDNTAGPPHVPPSAPSDGAASYPGPPRAERRIPMPEGSEIVIDSTSCLLVDLSSGGAQIRSPRMVRPNHSVRILLPKQEGPLLCKGRIVWAMYEPGKGDVAMYRAGLQFTDIDQRALAAVLLQSRARTNAPSLNAARR